MNEIEIRNKLKQISNLVCSDLRIVSIKSYYNGKQIEEIVRFGTITYDENGIIISKGNREILWKDVIDVSIYEE